MTRAVGFALMFLALGAYVASLVLDAATGLPGWGALVAGFVFPYAGWFANPMFLVSYAFAAGSRPAVGLALAAVGVCLAAYTFTCPNDICDPTGAGAPALMNRALGGTFEVGSYCWLGSMVLACIGNFVLWRTASDETGLER